MTKDKSTGFSHKKRFLMPTFFLQGDVGSQGGQGPPGPAGNAGPSGITLIGVSRKVIDNKWLL